MNVTLEKTSDNTAILNVAIQEADYQDKVTNELKTFGRTHTIPGFRKGHVSIDQLRRRFGRQMKSDVINHEAADAAIKYLQDNKINVLGQPLPVEVKEINLDDKDYNFQYEIGLAPELNIDLSDITVPYYTITVSKEMVEEQDRGLRERFGAQVPGEEVDKKALVKGALMELNADGTIKEGEDAIQVIDGIVAPMFFKDKEQADLFLGKKVGDKVVFNPWKTCEGNEAEMASMLHLDKQVAANVKADFEMVISEIIVVKLAELGEEYYKEVFGPDKVHNEEEYDKALREMIASSLEPNSEIMFRNDAQKAIMDKYGEAIQLPTEFLKKWLLVRNPELTKEALDKDFDNMLPGIKWQLIRENIAEANEMQITEDDLLGLAKNIARQQFAQYGMNNMDDDTITRFAKNILADKNYRPRLVEQVGDIKLFRIIQAKVNLDKKEVSLDEFKRLANPNAAE